MTASSSLFWETCCVFSSSLHSQHSPSLSTSIPPSLFYRVCECVHISASLPFSRISSKIHDLKREIFVKRHVIKFPSISMAKSWDVWRRFTLIWNFMFLLNWLLILKSAYLNWDALMVIHQYGDTFVAHQFASTYGIKETFLGVNKQLQSKSSDRRHQTELRVIKWKEK